VSSANVSSSARSRSGVVNAPKNSRSATECFSTGGSNGVSSAQRRSSARPDGVIRWTRLSGRPDWATSRVVT
jgi:hypothetical protein